MPDLKTELLEFIEKNNLKLFSNSKFSVKQKNSIFKTRDSKSVFSKTLSQISNSFKFSKTSSLFSFFDFSISGDEIKKRQEFFNSLSSPLENSFLSKLSFPKPFWNPGYDILVVTESDSIYMNLKKLDCPVKLLLSESDLQDLEEYDLIQVIDAESYSQILDTLPQTVFIDNTEDIYLERYLSLLSSWKSNIEILKEHSIKEFSEIISELHSLLPLISQDKMKQISKEDAELKTAEINENILEKIKSLNVSGENLVKILSQNSLPQEIQQILKKEISSSGFPEHIFSLTLPLKLDESELESLIKEQNSDLFRSQAETVKKNSEKIKKIPSLISSLASHLILYDFISGISKFISENSLQNLPSASDIFSIENSSNLFLQKPQPISFHLSPEKRCSILTGANSGGKTTLLEHIIQIISLFHIGLPCSGKVSLPVFSEIYYFSKNKGQASRGAFENLLEQMSKINPKGKTLILADEIEAVTEPGTAGKIISATADYFIKKDCFLVIATHLGQEIYPMLPKFSRIDGIEAKGLDNDFNLIVNHNPVINKLASSTPELIVEKLASVKQNPYFSYLNHYLKNKKN
jgi:hypothetical protein